jgi:uncharacterized membrane protein
MSALIDTKPANSLRADPRLPAAGGIMLGLVAFLLAPGSIAEKTHLALHGLCAQRPSHSLQLGGTTLPFDARMTGMYIGAAVTLSWLAALGRLQARRAPSRSVLLMLAIFVALLALDGFNALLFDLRAWHLYEPRNALRLATGVLGGTSLGVGLAFLFAVSIWAAGSPEQAVLERPRAIFPALGIAAVLAALALSGLSVLYAPFAVGLLLAAVGVFWTLELVLLALALDRGWTYRTVGELAPLAIMALAAAIATIAALSGLRLVAERALGLPQLT